MSGWKKFLAIGSALVFCPCHLPLWVGLLAGTAVGAYVNQYFIWLFAAFTVIFVISLSAALRSLRTDD
ncbi:mercury resistance protein [Candidatus Acetothermia bacterium]|nr:mercury resistance protein [Candidatus Acetothermia bacterium]